MRPPATVGRVRFLVSRRWILFAVAVAALAYGCFWLGEWQFARLEERKERNAQTAQNLRSPAAPVEQVLAVGEPVPATEEWRRVTASGTYLADKSVVVRYQTRDGVSGIDVVTPLRVSGTGDVLLVDRGWVRTDNAGDAAADVPEPPSGEVSITGWVRPDASGDSTAVDDRSTRAISSETIAPAIGEDRVYGGFVDVEKETPAPEQPLVHAELPELNNGPHFFYGLQWWFFALLAVFGFGYLAWDERRKTREPATSDEARTEQRAGASPS